MTDHGYLQHDTWSEKVRVRHEYADRWQAWYEGRWRRVHIQINRTYIVFQKQRITVAIDGV